MENREIKFRAWDSNCDTMFEWEAVKHWTGATLEWDNYTPMQFTGLLDKAWMIPNVQNYTKSLNLKYKTMKTANQILKEEYQEMVNNNPDKFFDSMDVSPESVKMCLKVAERYHAQFTTPESLVGERMEDVYRWVRASERMPKQGGEYYIQCYHEDHPETLQKGVVQIQSNGDCFFNNRFFKVHSWLEQVPATPSAAPVEGRSAEQLFQSMNGGKHSKTSVDHGETFTAIFVIQFAERFASQFRTQPANKEDMADGLKSEK